MSGSVLGLGRNSAKTVMPQTSIIHRARDERRVRQLWLRSKSEGYNRTLAMAKIDCAAAMPDSAAPSMKPCHS